MAYTKRNATGERIVSKYFSLGSNEKYSTNQKGSISEAAIIFRLTILNYSIYSSIFSGNKIDMIVEKNGELTKLQVKTEVTPKGYGSPTISIRCASGRNKVKKYNKGDFDFVVGYDLYTDKAYIYSWDEVKDKLVVSESDDAEERWDKLDRKQENLNNGHIV